MIFFVYSFGYLEQKQVQYNTKSIVVKKYIPEKSEIGIGWTLSYQ